MHSPPDYKTILQIYEPEFIRRVEEAIKLNTAVMLKLDAYGIPRELSLLGKETKVHPSPKAR